MFSLAAEHPVLSALVLLAVWWFATFLRNGYKVRKTFHDQVCHEQDRLLWRMVVQELMVL